MNLAVIFQSSILPIFIIVSIAFIYNKVMQPNIHQITNLALNIFVPALVFSSFVKYQVTIETFYKPLFFSIILTSCLIFLAYITSKAIKANEDERVSFILACSMINVGNFGLPLIYFTFGKGAERLSILYFIAFSIPLSSIAIFICSRESAIVKSIIDIFKIPIFYTLIIALIVSNMPVTIPGYFLKGIDLMGQAAIPLMIFILGLQLANVRFNSNYFKFIPLAIVIRLIISPVIAYLILTAFNIKGLERQVATVQTSAPAALLPIMYAIRFNRSPDLLAAIVLSSTILSGITLSIIIKFLY